MKTAREKGDHIEFLLNALKEAIGSTRKKETDITEKTILASKEGWVEYGIQMERERIKKIINDEMSYIGVLESNEKRRGYDIAIQEILTNIKEK